MSLLTLIDNIPLYSTQQEALQWGAALNIPGFHTHVFNGQIGYMPGYSHEDINLSLDLLNISFEYEEGNLEEYNPALIISQVIASTATSQIDETVDTTTATETTATAQDVIDTPQNTPTEAATQPTQANTDSTPSSGGEGGGY